MIFAALVLYTGVVVANHGLDLLPVFFGDMTKLAWPGQCNRDFTCMLALSGLVVRLVGAVELDSIAVGGSGRH
jgi:hypothetical protein